MAAGEHLTRPLLLEEAGVSCLFAGLGKLKRIEPCRGTPGAQPVPGKSPPHIPSALYCCRQHKASNLTSLYWRVSSTTLYSLWTRLI
jgi:hypothetical protein